VPLSSSFDWFSLKNEVTAFIRNVGNQSSNDTVSHRRRLEGPIGSRLNVNVKVKVKAKVKVKVNVKVKSKGKGPPGTGHEGPEGKMNSSTLPLTSAIDEGGWSTPRPDSFTPGKDPVSIAH
jgi:hypothetical protein